MRMNTFSWKINKQCKNTMSYVDFACVNYDGREKSSTPLCHLLTPGDKIVRNNRITGRFSGASEITLWVRLLVEFCAG